MAKSIRSTRSLSRKKAATPGTKAQKARPSMRKKLSAGAQASSSSLSGGKKSPKAQQALAVGGRTAPKGAWATPRGIARASVKEIAGKAGIRAKAAPAGRMSKRASQVKKALKKGFAELVKVGA